jgi:hypothetical protein
MPVVLYVQFENCYQPFTFQGAGSQTMQSNDVTRRFVITVIIIIIIIVVVVVVVIDYGGLYSFAFSRTVPSLGAQNLFFPVVFVKVSRLAFHLSSYSTRAAVNCFVVFKFPYGI